MRKRFAVQRVIWSLLGGVFLSFVVVLGANAQTARGLARTWTAADGRSVEMELREIKGETGVFFMAGDRKVELPLSRLADADQEVAKEW